MLNHAERHLERVIRRTIWVAGLSGQSYATQNEEAVHTLRRMRPDMTTSEALAKVDQVRNRWADSIRQVDQP